MRSSFTYVVAQIYGVGLIASRLTGVQFESGIMLGLGGVLVYSFLGGLKEPSPGPRCRNTLWCCWRTDVVAGVQAIGQPGGRCGLRQPFASHCRYGNAAAGGPEELQVRQEFERRAQVLEYKLSNVAQNLEQERQALQERVRYLRSIHSDMASIVQANREGLVNLPRTPEEAKILWQEQMHEYRQRSSP